jgi:hypothetical protein
VALPRREPLPPAAGAALAEPLARAETPGPAIFVGRIDIELGPSPSPAPGPTPIQRTHGFARYAKSRRGLRG